MFPTDAVAPQAAAVDEGPQGVASSLVLAVEVADPAVLLALAQDVAFQNNVARSV